MPPITTFPAPPEPGNVYHTDALTLLRAMPDASVDAVITDPPYGLAGRVFNVESKGYSAVNETWDYDAPVNWMTECKRILKPGGNVVCFGGRQSIYQLAAEGLRLGWRLVNDITWYKPDAPPNFTGRMMTESTERILWFCPDGTGWTYNLNIAKDMNLGINLRDVWTFYQTREERLHPTQKPLVLMERIIDLLTVPNALVVDCFAGAGTTLLAARNLNRRFIGGDITERYIEIAKARLAAPYTLPMFEQPAP